MFYQNLLKKYRNVMNITTSVVMKTLKAFNDHKVFKKPSAFTILFNFCLTRKFVFFLIKIFSHMYIRMLVVLFCS